MRYLGNALATVLTTLCLWSARTATAQVEAVPYALTGGASGQAFGSPGLLVDRKGNLYGTTVDGGPANGGTVFELSPVAGGGWAETTVYTFGISSNDGISPSGNLTWDEKGNLYGTTVSGGTEGSGTAFKLSVAHDGNWTEKVIYSFATNDTPQGGLVFDAGGNLYGTAQSGGSNSGPGLGQYGYGTVFELSPVSDGQWKEKILYSFGGYDTDGVQPNSGMVFDLAGNLYGTTAFGGADGAGTAFELGRHGDGIWTEEIVHDFGQTEFDGMYPGGCLLRDRYGNLYGTTFGGGTGGGGTVFELSRETNRRWTEKQIFDFTYPDDAAQDGSGPNAGLTMDAAGALYGTTEYGGANSLNVPAYLAPEGGTVFKLDPECGGTWSYTVLHSFPYEGLGLPAGQSDGLVPNGSVVLGPQGNLYGTTTQSLSVDASGYQVGTGYPIIFELEGATVRAPRSLASAEVDSHRPCQR